MTSSSRAFQLALSGSDELEDLLAAGAVDVTVIRDDGMYRGWSLLHAAAHEHRLGRGAVAREWQRERGQEHGCADCMQVNAIPQFLGIGAKDE